jgi:hypothetical protein
MSSSLSLSGVLRGVISVGSSEKPAMADFGSFSFALGKGGRKVSSKGETGIGSGWCDF